MAEVGTILTRGQKKQILAANFLNSDTEMMSSTEKIDLAGGDVALKKNTTQPTVSHNDNTPVTDVQDLREEENSQREELESTDSPSKSRPTSNTGEIMLQIGQGLEKVVSTAIHEGIQEVQQMFESTLICSTSSCEPLSAKKSSKTVFKPTTTQTEAESRPIRKHRQPKRRGIRCAESAHSSPDSTDEDELDNSQGCLTEISTPRTTSLCGSRNRSKDRYVKMPPFNGDKETWQVWYNRFAEIADRKGWDQERKLDELLPKMHGIAAEFVFGQLSRRTRSQYKNLVEELQNRFRKVETSKTFGAQFSHRIQKSNESVEEFAAELKRLYDKAYPERDISTRREDLLRKFLNGIQDERARFQVEYVKDPINIDDAVFEVVNFREMKASRNDGDKHGTRQTRKIARYIPLDSESSDDCEIDTHEIKISRIPDSKQSTPRADSGKRNIMDQSKFDNKSQLSPDIAQTLSQLAQKLSDIQDDMSSLKKQQPDRQRFHQQQDRQRFQPQQDRQGFQQQPEPRACYNCGRTNHFIKDCRYPKKPMGPVNYNQKN